MHTQKATRIKQKGSREQGTTRLFIAAEIPGEIKEQLSIRIRQYATYISRAITPENWHMTFLFIGMVDGLPNPPEALVQELPQAFFPTITLTHIGRGQAPGQLWAYAKPTAWLKTIRQQLQERVVTTLPDWRSKKQPENFIPHIKLADLRERSVSKFVADSPCLVTWPVKQLFLYNSKVYWGERKYDAVGKIVL